MNDDSFNLPKNVTSSFEPLIASSMNAHSTYTLWAPKNQSCLKMNEGFHIYMTQPVPNRWYQFWQKVFFGFVWEKVNN